MPDVQKFPNIDLDKWAAIKAAVLAKTGITIAGDLGADSAKGITLAWVYLPMTQDLKITLKKRSFYDPPAETIDVDVAELVASA